MRSYEEAGPHQRVLHKSKSLKMINLRKKRRSIGGNQISSSEDDQDLEKVQKNKELLNKTNDTIDTTPPFQSLNNIIMDSFDIPVGTSGHVVFQNAELYGTIEEKKICRGIGKKPRWKVRYVCTRSGSLLVYSELYVYILSSFNIINYIVVDSPKNAWNKEEMGNGMYIHYYVQKYKIM